MNLLMGVKVLLFILFIIYWGLLFQLIDQLLKRPRLTKPLRAVVCVFNAAVWLGALTVAGNSVLPYMLLLAMILLDLVLLYRDKFARILLCASACMINVLVIRAAVMGAVSIAAGCTVLEVGNQESLILVATALFAVLANVAILCVLHLVPLNYVRIINQHNEQLWFLIAWMSINNAYLLMDMGMSGQIPSQLARSVDRIAVSLSILLGLYIVLFFAIKTGSLLGYKEKNKALEHTVIQEQQYRDSITKDAIKTYEVNVTQDVIVHGFEERRDEVGDMATRYSEMLTYMTRKLVYSEDIPEFTRYADRENIIKLYEAGESETTVEYRRLLENGDYIWARAVSNIIQDEKSGDLIAFVYIKNIDAQKHRQLDLEYKAERDPLTGLYNKEITRKLVGEHLLSDLDCAGSALLMVDVDDFKAINDNFSHVYGDAVLCELADKLREIFRTGDIIGRIGGDEYVVYMKSCTSVEKIEERANEILRKFAITYTGLDGEGHAISGSVGIALYPQDGGSFEELYKFADAALYQAKAKGKSTYQRYDGSAFSGYRSNRTEIQTVGALSQKNFKQNRIEYVFKMLYQSENSSEAIYAVLELVARHFSFERGYIFETSKDGKTTSNTFEWCAPDVTPERDHLQHVPIASVTTANASFKKNGVFVLKSLSELGLMERAVLEPQGIKSMFQFGLFDKRNLMGFIGFDNCRSETQPSESDIDEMATICNVLATFFVKEHLDQATEQGLLLFQDVMNHLENYIYVINIQTFEVLFMNEKTRQMMKNANCIEPCYLFFRGKEAQCEDCPVRDLSDLSDHEVQKVIKEIYNEKLDIWIEASATSLRWRDGSITALINCRNITTQRNEHLEHIDQLKKLAYVDEVTGSRTYGKFKEDARRILEEQADRLHLLIKLDVENFKLVNQIFGYQKGDEILCCVAKALERTMCNEQEIFARIGNDEFIVLLQVERVDDANVMYERFLANFFTLVGGELTFKFRFPHGRCLIRPGDTDKTNIMDLFEKVNMAHKSAKLDKSMDFVLYDEHLIADALLRKEIENRMEGALLHQEFLVYLQPKYQLSDETIAGAEALARWKTDSNDLFFPDAFIPVFEKNGFVTKLDKYILGKVCAIIRGWMDKGIPPVTVSVNFSRLHLSNPQLVKELCQIVDSYGVDHRYIEVEITETVIYDNIETLAVLLEQLHAEGFTMSMDDFGSGYSSLGMLQNLPVDVIKMDRCFFVNQKDPKRAYTIVGSVIEMAAELGILIVAEGVEEKEQIDLLRALHCDIAQGYYFARPMSAAQFGALLEAQTSHALALTVGTGEVEKLEKL